MKEVVEQQLWNGLMHPSRPHDAHQEGLPRDLRDRSIIQFGRYTVDTRSRRFEVDGQAIELGSRAFDLLVALIESRGAIVSKDEIIRRVWPDVVVDEANLRVQLAKVRKALGEDRDLVRTVPLRGYLFASDATLVVVPETAGPPGALGAVAAPPSEETVTEALGNLPKPASPLIGRTVELVELRHSIGLHQLVTLVGPGGIGKTRLAVELGWTAASSFPDGVWLVDLAPLSDPTAVTSAAATALGVKLLQPETAVAAIASALVSRRALLIFDNCEHLIGAAAALIRELLARAPSLTVVATSQEKLDIYCEQVCRIGPLGVPSDATADVMGFGAVALFVERARAADRFFVLDQTTRSDVVEICRRLDGIPLALEMAAARVSLLGLAGLQDGLDERLRMLKGNRHGIHNRHPTLRDMVEWSHGLLDKSDQEVFRRLAVFAGSFSLEAAAAVVGPDRPDRWDVADSLGRLIDKSLITIVRSEPPRYRLLETLRLYAAEQLAASGEREDCCERHARYFAEQAEQAYDSWRTTPEKAWLATGRLDLDNIRAAMDWALAGRSRAATAIALTGATTRLWLRLGLIAEGRQHMERVLPLVGPEAAASTAARLFKQAGSLWSVADGPRQMAFLEQAATLYRQIGDRVELPGTLTMIGDIYASRGQLREAKALLDEAKDLLADGGSKKSLFSVMNSLGIVATSMADFAQARVSFARALALAQETQNTSAENITLINLAELEFVTGDIEQAIEWGREAVGRLRLAGERSRLGGALYNLAAFLLIRNDPVAARPIAEEALSLVREEGGMMIAFCLLRWALLGALEGRYSDAARLTGFVDLAFASRGEARQKLEQQLNDRLTTLLSAALSPESIQNRAAEGASWDEAQALRFTTDRLLPLARSSERTAAGYAKVSL